MFESVLRRTPISRCRIFRGPGGIVQRPYKGLGHGTVFDPAGVTMFSGFELILKRIRRPDKTVDGRDDSPP